MFAVSESLDADHSFHQRLLEPGAHAIRNHCFSRGNVLIAAREMHNHVAKNAEVCVNKQMILICKILRGSVFDVFRCARPIADAYPVYLWENIWFYLFAWRPAFSLE